jgi:hypothetical protein
VLTHDPAKQAAVDEFREQRLHELHRFLEVPRTGPEIRDFVRREIPPDLLENGLRVLKSDQPAFKHPRLQLLGS